MSIILPLAGLGGELRVRFDNAIRCLPDRPQGRLDLNRDKDRELLSSCSSGMSLYSELEDNPGTLL